MIEIIHGGQTGVDRGAHEAATDLGWPITGYMPKDRSDENGVIPKDVAKHLRPCVTSGYPARTDANLGMAQFLLVVVPDETDPYATPGTRLTLVSAREIRIARLVVQPSEFNDHLITRTLRHHLAKSAQSQIRVMVAGPRASRWADGRIVTAALLRRLAFNLLHLQAT